MRLNAKTARDLMTAGPVSLDADRGTDSAAAFLTERGFGAALVIDAAGHPIGVVTKTDLLIHARERARSGKLEPATARDVMTPAVFSVREDTKVESVVEQLLALNVHHLFVIDPAGVVVGVISPVDVLKKLAAD
jgi:CBS-domain-containing membrane protein